MCGVGAKSVAHLKFHLLQWEVVKVKFLMNSNMTLTNPGQLAGGQLAGGQLAGGQLAGGHLAGDFCEG